MADDLPRNQAIEFIAKTRFPDYSTLRRIRRKTTNRSDLSEDQRTTSTEIAKYLCELRAMDPDHFRTLLEHNHKQQSDRIEAAAKQRAIVARRDDERRFDQYRLKPHELDYWAKMDCWSFHETVTLSLGMAPDRISKKVIEQWRLASPLAKEYVWRWRLISRACRSGKLSKPIVPSEFIEWTSAKTIGCSRDLMQRLAPQLAIEHKIPFIGFDEYPDPSVVSSTKTKSQELVHSKGTAFDSETILNIAKIFKECGKDGKWWARAAAKAKSNGLHKARRVTGAGKGKSLFDPEDVGYWLLEQKLLLEKDILTILCDSLPKRSEHLRDYYRP